LIVFIFRPSGAWKNSADLWNARRLLPKAPIKSDLLPGYHRVRAPIDTMREPRRVEVFWYEIKK